MSRDMGRHLIEEMTKEMQEMLNQDHHGLLDGLLSQISYKYMANLKKEQRKALTNVSKRIFDKSQRGMELRKALIEKISTRINVKEQLLPKFLEKMLDTQILSSEIRPSYDSYFSQEIPKLLRENLLSALVTDSYKKEFYTFDHQSKRIKLEEDMKRTTEQLLTRHGIKLSSQVVDTVIRLVEYLFRKHSKVVPESRYQLAIYLQQNYSDTSTIGSVFVGLIDLSDTYLGISDQQHFSMLQKALELIDQQSVGLLMEAKNKDFKKISKILRDFIESLSCSMLNLRCSSYVIDQLLIKIRNKFDIYLIFSMVIALITAQGGGEQKIDKPQQSIKSAGQNLRNPRNLPTEDLFTLFQDRAYQIELPMLIKIFTQVYDGVKLYESPFAQISNEEVAHHSRPLKQCAVGSYLQECQPEIAKIHGKSKISKSPRPTKQNEPENLKKQFGLIAPDINLDY